MKMRVFAAGICGLALMLMGGCAASGEPVMTVEQAARADCERRDPPPADMDACIFEAERTIRDARDLARRQAPREQPRPPG